MSECKHRWLSWRWTPTGDTATPICEKCGAVVPGIPNATVVPGIPNVTVVPQVLVPRAMLEQVREALRDVMPFLPEGNSNPQWKLSAHYRAAEGLRDALTLLDEVLR